MALAVCALIGAPAFAQQPTAGKYGKRLVASYRVPAETIAKYAEIKAPVRRPGDSQLDTLFNADTIDWTSTPFDARTADNPHTIVVTLTGSAKETGDAASMWQAGWKLPSGETVGQFMGLSKPAAKAGEWFMVTAAAPTTFKENRSVAVSLGLATTRNMDIRSVQVEVWSGFPSTGFADYVLAFRWLLLGGILAALAWFFGFRKRG